MTEKDFAPLPSDEVLEQEFLIPLKLSQHKLALNMHVSPQKINDIVRGKRGISANIALELALTLGTTPEFWMGLQSDYDLETASDLPGARLQHKVLAIQRQLAEWLLLLPDIILNEFYPRSVPREVDGRSSRKCYSFVVQ